MAGKPPGGNKKGGGGRTPANRSRSRRPAGDNPKQARGPRGKGRPLSPGWASRLAAADLIVKTCDDNQDLEEALSTSAHFDRLEGADRGFARAIASCALRALGRIDKALDGFLDRPLSDMDPAVRALLRCGAAQIWVMGSPSYAVVSATVDAARQWPDASRGGGLVNAILRRADREPEAFADLDPLTIWPDWLATNLKASLGPARALAMAKVHLLDPSTDITVKSKADDWAEKLGGELLPSGSIRLPAGAALTELPGYADGDWWVQDAAAALPARLMGDLTGKRVADLCAAPGGKTMQLCALGAKVTALDSSAPRLDRLRENLNRTDLMAKIVNADARDWSPDEPLDAILLDAPCSALGTMRRHPDGAWRRSPKGIAQYPKLQSAILEAAGKMLKSGGTLVYAVCTPIAAEGHEVIAAALKDKNWCLDPIRAEEVPGFAHGLDEKGCLLTAPVQENETEDKFVTSDVFFIARLRRN